MSVTSTDQPWRDGETERYEACGSHRAALSRMSFEDAWERAAQCRDCAAEFRK